MSDPLLDFLLSRDPDKVLAEARPVSLEKLYAEASIEDRELLDDLPVGVLRRRLVEAERALAAVKRPKTRVVANGELLEALRKATVERDRLRAKVAELRELLGKGGEAA